MKKFGLLLIALVITFAYARTDGERMIEKRSEKKITEKAKKIPPTPRLISDGYELTIEPASGQMLIGESQMLFTAGISPSFKNWDLNKPSVATKKTTFRVYETCGNGNFLQYFVSLTNDTNDLAMTQEQIISICTMYPEWLRQEEYMNLFLIKMDGAYLVVNITVKADCLSASVNHLGGSKTFEGSDKHRVFVPFKISRN